MFLQSNLPVLLEFDLNRLLAVQNDVTALISRRVRELLDKPEPDYHEQLTIRADNVAVSKCNENVEVASYSDFKKEEQEDNEAFICTQLELPAREKLLNQESEDLTVLQSELPKPDISSPLKESQTLSDSSEYNASAPKKLCRQEESVILPSADGAEARQLPKSNLFATKKICIKPTGIAPSVIDLNVNPLTGKPWILEDFKRNEDVSHVRKCRKNIKLQKFYAGGCPPPESDMVPLEENQMECTNNTLHEFENLRERSHSPPGFGRLDFPNTQERFDDKRKSQNIIFHKTKWRFRKATCSAVSQQEREYLFKNESLNQLIDNGKFEWNDAKLQIYMR